MIDAHAMLATIAPYLAGAAHRAAPRYGIEPADLFQDFALHLLERADDFDPATDNLKAFAWTWIRQVLGRRFFVRWQRMSRWGELSNPTNDPRGDDPADRADLEDSLDRLRRGLAYLSPRRREAVALRFGLDGIGPLAGVELGKALGIRPQTACDLVTAALRELAVYLGTDPAKARVSVAEGRSLGWYAGRARREPPTID